MDYIQITKLFFSWRLKLRFFSRNKILEIVGEEHVFGRKRGVGLSDGVKGGMREGPIDKRKEEMGVYVGYIVKLRKGISRRNPPLPFFSLINNLKLLDQVRNRYFREDCIIKCSYTSVSASLTRNNNRRVKNRRYYVTCTWSDFRQKHKLGK